MFGMANPALSARERRQQKTRQAILDAAWRVIEEEGPEELSMRGLAERIDYSPSGLYEYFDSKEQIIQAVCGEGHMRLFEAMRAVDENLPPEQYLVQIGQKYVDFAAANRELFQLMFASVPAEPPSPSVLTKRSSYLVLQNGIQRGINQGVFKSRDDFSLQEMSFAAWSMVHGISMLRIYMKEPTQSFEHFRHQALLAIVRGLMSP
jgi:AcrR family transcriptional regulator